MNPLKLPTCAILVIALSIGNGCTQSKAYTSPAEYNLNAPIIHKLEKKLTEISGISFKPGDDRQFFAIEDEHGKLYRISPDGSVLGRSNFAKKGDYEDVAVTSAATYILRSDGTIFLTTIPSSDADISSTPIEDVLPAGEYEGMAVESDKSLVVLCKDCKIKGTKGKVIIYHIAIEDSSHLKASSPTEVQVLDESKGDEKERIAASGIARNPLNGKWYIISSVNKLLIVLNSDFSAPVKYNLDPALYPQPEGICFDSKGNLFISNEGGGGHPTVLQFNKR